jgi:glycine cleavage system regulatory protein
MTTEERILRLENSFNTLAELAAQSDARDATLADLVAKANARTDALIELAARSEARTDTLEEFAADVRAFTRILTEITRRHGERLEDHDSQMAELRAAQANTEHKLAALVDAQIKTEDALRRLTEKVDRLAGNG